MQGIVSEQKVDSFNIPIYFMCLQEFESAVEQNGCFSIERMQVLPPVLVNGTLPNAHQTAIWRWYYRRAFCLVPQETRSAILHA